MLQSLLAKPGRVRSCVGALALAALVAGAAAQPTDATYMGLWGTPYGDPLTIDTRGAAYDTELAVWNAAGDLVAFNDDIEPGLLQSELVLGGLVAGRYYAVCVGYNAVFRDGFIVEPGTSVGLPIVRLTNGIQASASGTSATSGPLWVSFDIVDIRELPFARFGVPVTDLGILNTPGRSFEIMTADGGFDSEIAVWNAAGDLIATNDDAPGGGNGSLVSLVDLDPGVYIAAIFDSFGVATSGFRAFQGVNPVFTQSERFDIGDFYRDTYIVYEREGIEVMQFTVFDDCVPPACLDPMVIDEGEPPYDPIFEDDTTNGGCNFLPNLYTPARIGQAFCGTAVLHRNTVSNPTAETARRDTDWYRFDLPQRTDLRLVLDAEVPSTLVLADRSLLPDPCLMNVSSPDYVTPGPCSSGVLEVTVDAGSYLAIVVPQFGMYGSTNYGLTLTGRPSESVPLGAVAFEGIPFDISTDGSFFDTEIGLYDDVGVLLAANDDVVPGVLTSELADVVLPAGRFHLAVAGYNTDFFGGFAADVFAGGFPSEGGALALRVGSRSLSGNVGSGEALWYTFDVAPQVPCNAADIIPPLGELNIDDVLGFLEAFTGENPAADLAPPAGVFDIDDVLTFLANFAAGCP